MTRHAVAPLDLELARRGLAAQPFSELLGAWEDLRQQNGFLHGGVICYW